MSLEARIIGYCRMCGKALEEGEAAATDGTLYCAEHAPHLHAATDAASAEPPRYAASTLPGVSPYAASQPPPLPRTDEHVSPPLAFVLGFIPGVGAVYNGQ